MIGPLSGPVWFLVTFYASAAETQASLDRDRASIGARTTETNRGDTNDN